MFQYLHSVCYNSYHQVGLRLSAWLSTSTDTLNHVRLLFFFLLLWPLKLWASYVFVTLGRKDGSYIHKRGMF